MANDRVTVIGGGLAGAEAAWRLVRAGVPTRLYEMRPAKLTPAHRTGLLAELVCSNSLKSESVATGPGLLKRELTALDSLVMKAARESAVPAGQALAVDREGFAGFITRALESAPGLELVREELERPPDSGLVVVATGPLSSEAISAWLAGLVGAEALAFYDAIAPIVSADSIDFSIAFKASRYGKGDDDYINCPMSRAEYEAFVAALLAARRVPPREFEDPSYFEGCLPIEVMAERGLDTLAHGPMKPVGLIDPRDGRRPHAVVQLRQDNAAATLYNLVGFQTRLAHPEQERVFRMIPGLANVEFARLGSAHRNTFIDSPRLLDPFLRLRADPRLFFAGQITGVEGYLASAAAGTLAGINAARAYAERPLIAPGPETMLGALLHYVTDPTRQRFQPMAPNFGILAPLETRVPKSARKEALAQRALAAISAFAAQAD